MRTADAPSLVNLDRTQVLVDGEWRAADAVRTFPSHAPATGEHLADVPVSSPADVEAVLTATTDAATTLRATPPEHIATFLERLAAQLEQHADVLTSVASLETGLPVQPRLLDVELPRTTGQLRQAADAARSRSWRRPQLAPAARIAAWHAPLPGAVLVLGPNNFPLAFNPAAGGDFAAAIATHHPVVAKSNPGHPGTTALLAELARRSAVEAGLPAATVQLLHAVDDEVGLRLVADRRLAATAYTGSRRAGLALKAAADAAGIPIYLEMSATNPVAVLSGAARERGGEIGAELGASVLGSGGQMCTKPGLLVVEQSSVGPVRDALVAAVDQADPVVVLGPGVATSLQDAAEAWTEAGARRIAGHDDRASSGAPGLHVDPSLYEVDGDTFLARPDVLGAEAFGPMALLVVATDAAQLAEVLAAVEPGLTGAVFASSSGADDAAYAEVRDVLLPRVGRFLDDKVPTGVAVVPTMHHGGPYPSTGHAAFTSVGIPESLLRFTARQAFDHVADDHLPPELQAGNPLELVREVDGRPTTEPITWGQP